jgi:hypothetical protein
MARCTFCHESLRLCICRALCHQCGLKNRFCRCDKCLETSESESSSSDEAYSPYKKRPVSLRQVWGLASRSGAKATRAPRAPRAPRGTKAPQVLMNPRRATALRAQAENAFRRRAAVIAAVDAAAAELRRYAEDPASPDFCWVPEEPGFPEEPLDELYHLLFE